MKLKQILSFLDIEKEKFESMTAEEWQELTTKKLLEANEKIKNNRDEKKHEDLRIACLMLQDQTKRQEVLALAERKEAYQHLFVAAADTPANKERKAEDERLENPPKSVAAQAEKERPLNCDIVGETVKEIEKNRETIIKEYREYTAKKYADFSPEEREKYEPQDKFFKTYTDFSKSAFYKTLSDEEREKYANEGFPQTITVIDFAKKEDREEFLSRDSIKQCLRIAQPLEKEAPAPGTNPAPNL